MSSPWPDEFRAPQEACGSQRRTPAFAQGAFLSHPIYRTKRSDYTFHFDIGALSTEPTAAMTLGRPGKLPALRWTKKQS